MPYSQPIDLSEYLKTADLPVGVQFVSPTPLLIADLMANFPAGAAYKGKYAQVVDLWGASVFGAMRCGYNGRIYYWEPTTQPTFFTQLATSASMTILALGSAPIIEITGTVPTLTTHTATIDLTNAWPGMVKEFRGSFSSLLGTFNIVGTGIGSTLSLALNTNKRFAVYDTGAALAVRQLT